MSAIFFCLNLKIHVDIVTLISVITTYFMQTFSCCDQTEQANSTLSALGFLRGLSYFLYVLYTVALLVHCGSHSEVLCELGQLISTFVNVSSLKVARAPFEKWK